MHRNRSSLVTLTSPRALLRRRGALICAPLLAVTATSAIASGDSGAPFRDGARCLFIGHSFFVPVADAFGAVASQNDFPSHDMETVFRGGSFGSPGALWDDAATRAEVEATLATGEIELFGLTYFTPNNSGFDQYAQWIDLALQYNPDTRFFVGVPWAPGGHSMDTAMFDGACEQFALAGFAVVDQLRAAYPGSRIEFIGYGKTASVMKRMFDSGDLPDITGLVPDPANGVPDDEALFADPFIGHGGPMLLELASLSWMDILYGTPTSQLVFTGYQADVQSIVGEVLAFNEQFEYAAASACNAADLSEPLGQLTFADVSAFLAAFSAQDVAADLVEPVGEFTFADVSAFLGVFTTGCP